MYVSYSSISRKNMGITKKKRTRISVLRLKKLKLQNYLQRLLIIVPAFVKQASYVTMDGRLLWMCTR